MRIVWFTWKDKKNPAAGGAEVVDDGLATRLARDGHDVLFVTAGFPNGKKEENINGYRIVRLGNRFSVYWSACRYYKKNLQGKADLVIDEINTIPFFAKCYIKEKSIIVCYQLCREIWFYQMFFPLNALGYLMEPLYLWLLRKQTVLTESESTKKDLQKYGFDANRISVFPIGLETPPVDDLRSVKKFDRPTVLFLGTLRSMKRPLHVVQAFEIAKGKISELRLMIAGNGDTGYGKKALNSIARSQYRDSIEYLGKVGPEKKIELMRKCHVICVTSVKEGWGMIVTEANSQGTPAVVYDVDGLRDAVRNGKTGLVCDKNTPRNLSEKILTLLQDSTLYDSLRIQAWEDSKKMTLENSYRRFVTQIHN